MVELLELQQQKKKNNKIWCVPKKYIRQSESGIALRDWYNKDDIYNFRLKEELYGELHLKIE